MADGDTLLLIELPDDIYYRIFLYLSYDEITRNRQVCRRFNDIGWHALNRGFIKAQKLREASEKQIILARRPDKPCGIDEEYYSARIRCIFEIKILEYKLSNAFGIRSELCFIPGKIIDELFRFLKYLDPKPQSTHTFNDVLAHLLEITTNRDLQRLSSLGEKAINRLNKNLKGK